MSPTPSRTPWASQSLHNRILLSIYDWFALGIHCRWIWQCTAGRILEFYNQHISCNHLDIGVGTGYFLDKCRFPAPGPRIALLDINPASLAMAQKRLERYRPQIYQRDILQPLDLDTQGFDSIALSHVLHCLPGSMETKEIVFSHILPLLNPGGIVFGNTFLYRGVEHNWLAGNMFWLANKLGYMSNIQDTYDALARSLKKYFRESHIEICGSEALFWARR